MIADVTMGIHNHTYYPLLPLGLLFKNNDDKEKVRKY